MKPTLLLLITTLIFTTGCHSQPMVPHSKPRYIDGGSDTLTILTYGLAPMRSNAANNAAARWRVKYYAVAGCVVTSELLDSIKKHNDHVGEILSARHGADWQQQLEKLAQDEQNLYDKQIMPLVKQYVMSKPPPGKWGGYDGLIYHISPTPDLYTYRVKVETIINYAEIENYVTAYDLQVNFRTKTVTLLQ